MMKRKVKNKMIKGNLLREKLMLVVSNWFTLLNRLGFLSGVFEKLNNETEFKASEVMILKELLHLTDDEVMEIFLPKMWIDNPQ